ncbi:hypothetical protein LEM8419_01608 [Neolewinella maritima]|uniref:Uncharacterized protein n=1 Tax=Neolewinella maritima TaxID=1383882 RepID=A0ABM9B1C7_9BACT|nr:hypothetical protein [Neolewinella maritima]CAH1000455.1 hypothetical protein LEM8419_01608 [Neolewinella maritima]
MNTALLLIGQLIIYSLLMLADEYAGTLLAAILGTICFAIWGLSHLVELVQPSRVSKSYYTYVLTGWVAPALALIGFIYLRGGIGWL